MDYQIVIERPWSYRHPKHGRQTLAPGRYAVPDQVADEIARRALAEGMAQRIEVAKPAAPPAAAQSPAQAKKPKRKYERRKKRSPEDKMLGDAPENKSVLV